MKPDLKKRLSGGECLIGAGMWISTPEAIEWVATGLDWVWWECQHTQVDWQTTMYGVRASHLAGLPIVVRGWTHDGGVIERLLDMGADGILVPMVDTAEQGKEIVSHCYFPPLSNCHPGNPGQVAPRAAGIGGNRRRWNALEQFAGMADHDHADLYSGAEV